MTRKELAEMLGISLRSLDNWEKEKPDLVRLINQGLALEDSIEETKRHLQKLEDIRKDASNGKFKLK
jgi:transcriptional regulator with XRE-family HTH domain